MSDDRAEECPGRGCLVYLCPQSGESECTQHGGFDVCCDDPACPSRLLDRLAAAEAEVERLTLTDTELCQCPEGPYFGAQMAPSIPRCERCRRPSDPRVMALLAEVERLHRLVGEQTTKARDAITERDDLRRRHSHLQQRVLAVAMPEQILAILDAPQTDGGGAHDRRPEPGDGPEYAADLAAWLERNGGDGR